MIYLVSESEVEKTYEMFYGENALFDFRTKKYFTPLLAICSALTVGKLKRT